MIPIGAGRCTRVVARQRRGANNSRMASPIILSTWSFGPIGTRAGWKYLFAPNSALDAVEEACIAVENDPQVDSVGTGGLPDASGQVTLDACVMLSPAQCAGVAGVHDFANPASIARQVMQRTPHKMLVGVGAETFAELCGFKRANLLTESARQQWQEWKRTGTMPQRRANREEPAHDTVGVLAIDSGGLLAGACSTSGLPFKLPGRVGDSPIIGHGLYVDPSAGAAVATGDGELMMGTCASFLAVELLRSGVAPMDALRGVLQRIADSYGVMPHQQAALIVLAPTGEFAAGALRPGFKLAVKTEDRDELTPDPFVLFPTSSSGA